MAQKATKQALRKEAVLASLTEGASTTKACKAAGINRNTYYAWRNKDPAFLEATDVALDSRIHSVEDALYRKALDGNTTAQIFFLCNRSNGRWRHVQHIQHSGGIDHGLKPDLAALLVAARNNGHGIGQKAEDRAACLSGDRVRDN